MLHSLVGAQGTYFHADNPIDLNLSINLPAGTSYTQALIYTVGAGRVAFIEAVYAFIGGTATIGQALLDVRVNRSGANLFLMRTVSPVTPAVVSSAVAYSVWLEAGDSVTMFYQNTDAVARNITASVFIREIIA